MQPLKFIASLNVMKRGGSHFTTPSGTAIIRPPPTVLVSLCFHSSDLFFFFFLCVESIFKVLLYLVTEGCSQTPVNLLQSSPIQFISVYLFRLNTDPRVTFQRHVSAYFCTICGRLSSQPHSRLGSSSGNKCLSSAACVTCLHASVHWQQV